MRRDPTPEKLDIYELKMALFENNEPEEFLLFVRNFQMTLEDSGGIATRAKIQYLCTLLRGEALHQLDMLSVEVGITTTRHSNCIILGLGMYFPLSIRCQSKNAQCVAEGGRRAN